MDYFSLIGRKERLFQDDLTSYQDELSEIVAKSKFLVVGGAGTIGQAVALEIFKRNPIALHIVDLSENNMVELVREIRSTMGYINGDFKTFAIDCGSVEFEVMANNEGPYDYIFNLSALKHPRSESDPYTLMRMISVNILNTLKIAKIAREHKCKKYFCVSTDKAANPVNMMGASKRIMEQFLIRESMLIPISMARFANVAFSDGSLLDGFNRRFAKHQPFSAPNDVRRYFVTPQESGELCLISALLGENRDLFFPKPSVELHLTRFSDIAERYLLSMGFKPYLCKTEAEARQKSANLIDNKQWPCFFFESDTTGEKDVEEFFTSKEVLDLDRFSEVGIVKNSDDFDGEKLDYFLNNIQLLRDAGTWSRQALITLFNELLPEFNHLERGKFLDQRM